MLLLAFLFTPATLGLLFEVLLLLLLSMLMTVVTVALLPPSSNAAISRSRLLGIVEVYNYGMVVD